MKPFLRDINLTEARRRLSSILREIEAEPNVGYQIKVRDKVVAELRSPPPRRGYRNAGEALVALAREAERLATPRRKGHATTSENYKEFLYGRQRPPLSRKRA